MPIPNVASLYQRIEKGSEGGHEFARFVRLLLEAEYSGRGRRFIAPSDASGDYRRLDAFSPRNGELNELITGFQFKFFPGKLSSGQRTAIKKSLELAVQENKYLEEFILVTPENFMKEQQKWFDTLRNEHECGYSFQKNGIITFFNFQITHWGHDKLVELALKHEHIGRQYFHELFPFGVGTFKLSKISILNSKCLWESSSHNENGFYLNPLRSYEGPKTTDPVFDFQFKNSTPEIHLLHKVEIKVISIETRLKGIPSEEFLRSVGTIQYEMDFSSGDNTIAFSDPMIFKANSPKRFSIQLIRFAKNCPGNCATIQFWFYFDEITIPTNEIYLGFT